MCRETRPRPIGWTRPSRSTSGASLACSEADRGEGIIRAGGLGSVGMSLDDKVAVVTGATKGVGRGIACELARQGARVFVTGRSAPDHDALDKQITSIRCDHRLDAEVEAAFNLIGRDG